MSKKQVFFSFCVLAGINAYAQETTAVDSLDQVVITANKYPQKQSSTAKTLTIIDRNTLEKNAGRTLTQVLNEQAGLVIAGAQSSPGSVQNVYLRGAATPNTLILVDGAPINDASGIASETDLNFYAMEQIERIEILKGSQSVLYGSDAVAGVINIITKKQTQSKPVEVNAIAAAGSYGTFNGTAGVQGALGKTGYNVQYSRLQSDGFSSAQDKTGNNQFDKDGMKQDVVSAGFQANPAANWQLRLNGQYSKYRADIDDNSFEDDKNHNIANDNLFAGLSSIYNFNKGSFQVKLNLNNTHRRLDDPVNTPPAGPSDYDPYWGDYKSKTLFAETFINIDLSSKAGLVAGLDMRDQKADIETAYGKIGSDSLKSTQYSGYASLLLKPAKGFSLETGARITHHSAFGSAFTYSINPSYTINDRVKLFANIGSAFRSPSVYQLASEYGNAGLEPEKTLTYEGGLQYFNPAQSVSIRATYFNRSTKDVIIFKPLSAPPYGQYDNADKQKDHGLELEATLRFSPKWKLNMNYAYVDGKIQTLTPDQKDTSYFNLYRRPKNNINATLGFQATGKWYISVGGRWVDSREDVFYNSAAFASEKVKMDAYYNLDLHTSYKVFSFLTLFADLRNITDQQYYEVYGYNTRGFNVMAGARVRL